MGDQLGWYMAVAATRQSRKTPASHLHEVWLDDALLDLTAFPSGRGLASQRFCAELRQVSSQRAFTRGEDCGAPANSAEGIHRIEDSDTNSYLIEEDVRLSVVDTGLPTSWPSLSWKCIVDFSDGFSAQLDVQSSA